MGRSECNPGGGSGQARSRFGPREAVPPTAARADPVGPPLHGNRDESPVDPPRPRSDTTPRTPAPGARLRLRLSGAAPALRPTLTLVSASVGSATRELRIPLEVVNTERSGGSETIFTVRRPRGVVPESARLTSLAQRDATTRAEGQATLEVVTRMTKDLSTLAMGITSKIWKRKIPQAMIKLPMAALNGVASLSGVI